MFEEGLQVSLCGELERNNFYLIIKSSFTCIVQQKKMLEYTDELLTGISILIQFSVHLTLPSPPHTNPRPTQYSQAIHTLIYTSRQSQKDEKGEVEKVDQSKVSREDISRLNNAFHSDEKLEINTYRGVGLEGKPANHLVRKQKVMEERSTNQESRVTLRSVCGGLGNSGRKARAGRCRLYSGAAPYPLQLSPPSLSQLYLLL